MSEGRRDERKVGVQGKWRREGRTRMRGQLGKEGIRKESAAKCEGTGSRRIELSIVMRYSRA